MKKIVISFMVLLVMTLGLSSEVLANTSFNVSVDNEDVKVYNMDLLLNNNLVSSEFKPYIYNDRAFVPVRVVAEYFNSNVYWTQDSKTVTISKGNNIIVISVDSNQAMKNNEIIELDNSLIPRLVCYPNGEYKTMIPLRAVSELLGYEFEWDQETRQAIIKEPIEKVVDNVNKIIDIEGVNISTENEQINIFSQNKLEYTSIFEDESNIVLIEFFNAIFQIDDNPQGKMNIDGSLIDYVEYTSDLLNKTSKMKIQLNRFVKYDIKEVEEGLNISFSLENHKDQKDIIEDDDMEVIPEYLSDINITKQEGSYNFSDDLLFANDAKIEKEIIQVKPRKTPKSKEEIKIVIDPGHGGKDSGAIAVNGIQEKELNLDIALRTRDILEQEGYIIKMTRESDQAVNIYKRPLIANKEEAHIFLSIHANSSKRDEVSGIETLYAPRSFTNVKYDEQFPLADNIHKELIRQTNMIDMGIKQRPDLIVLRQTEMPAVLVELGFISNEDNLEVMETEEFKNNCAQAMANGIISYIGETYNL